MMVISFQQLVKGVYVLGLIAALTACGGDGGGKKDNPQSSTAQVLVSSSKGAVSNNSSSAASSISEASSSNSLASSSSSSRLPSVLIGGAVQGNPLDLTNVVSTFAGEPLEGVDGIGTASRFRYPLGIVRVGGDIYIADASSFTIRKFVIATGEVTTIAGTPNVSSTLDGVGNQAQFSAIEGITTDGVNLYICDRHTIRKMVLSTREVTTLAGGPNDYSGADGVGTAARFVSPTGIIFHNGNLYVTDSYKHTVRRIEVATREVTTFAGTNGINGNTDGVGTSASFYSPHGIATDGENLYVADHNNDLVRKIVIATAAVSTIAGGGAIDSDGVGIMAGFHRPTGLAVDETYLYVSEASANRVRRVLLTTGEVITLAGSRLRDGSNDGSGDEASFNSPRGITFDENDLYVSDAYNNSIRKIEKATGTVSTVAGKKIYPCSNGAAADASFDRPRGVTTDGQNLYVADFQNRGIRKIALSTGETSTLTGCVTYPGIYYPSRISFNDGNLYVSDSNSIKKVVVATGEVMSLAGISDESGAMDGIGEAASFNYLDGIVVAGDSLYAVDSGNYTVRKIVLATGAVSTFVGTAGVSGSSDGLGGAASFNYASDITTDGSNLYVLDSGNYTIRKIVIATGAVTTLAGSAGNSASTDGIGSQARFYRPSGITTDGVNLYVTDNQTVRRVSIATGEVFTLAGAAETPGAVNGPSSAARFAEPYGLTTDGFSLFVADTNNNVIRKIQ